MGKIVKNGVAYCGSSDNAVNVKYNNNESNLDAENVQEAVDQLNTNLSNTVTTINSQLDKKANVDGPTIYSSSLKWVQGSNTDITSYPRIELRRGGTLGTSSDLRISYISSDGDTHTYKLVNSDGEFLPSMVHNNDVITVAQGGTGATTAAQAKLNLGLPSTFTFGQVIATFSSGKATLAFSAVGMTERPNTLFLMACSSQCIVRYDWDASTSNIVLYGTKVDGTATSGAVRFSYTCMV